MRAGQEMSCCPEELPRDLFVVTELLDRACDGRERVIGVVADQANCADNEHQDYSQHHRIFRDVLTYFVSPHSGGGRTLHSFLGWSVFGFQG
jgi:hypothetical protein